MTKDGVLAMVLPSPFSTFVEPSGSACWYRIGYGSYAITRLRASPTSTTEKKVCSNANAESTTGLLRPAPQGFSPQPIPSFPLCSFWSMQRQNLRAGLLGPPLCPGRQPPCSFGTSLSSEDEARILLYCCYIASPSRLKHPLNGEGVSATCQPPRRLPPTV